MANAIPTTVAHNLAVQNAPVDLDWLIEEAAWEVCIAQGYVATPELLESLKALAKATEAYKLLIIGDEV